MQADKLFTWKTLWGVGPVYNFALQWCVPALSQLGGKMCQVLLILKITTTQIKDKLGHILKGSQLEQNPCKDKLNLWNTPSTHCKSQTISQYPEATGAPLNTPTMIPSLPCSLDWESPSFPVLQICFIRGKWFVGSALLAPQRFSHSSPVIYRTTRCLLCNTYTKETKLLQISILIQKQHPNHADTAMLPDSCKK